ncbi:protein of unknown function [Vibrio tapetis subsp. tapetis]|uniref:Uncharacterized protein n=1 Tax=Vibrio tapetis subsp. tapetis TaxID=1671868 RepID=A0A2N8ZKT2_9VIBR|nr:protein of unknown function [Vibrio tapetis subsp. tapetis]
MGGEYISNPSLDKPIHLTTVKKLPFLMTILQATDEFPVSNHAKIID